MKQINIAELAGISAANVNHILRELKSNAAPDPERTNLIQKLNKLWVPHNLTERNLYDEDIYRI